jgi:hypothetical protein
MELLTVLCTSLGWSGVVLGILFVVAPVVDPEVHGANEERKRCSERGTVLYSAVPRRRWVNR